MNGLRKYSSLALAFLLAGWFWGASQVFAQTGCDFAAFQRQAVTAVGSFVASPSTSDFGELQRLASEGERCVSSTEGFQKFLAHYLAGYLWYSVGVGRANEKALDRARTHFGSAVQTYDNAYSRAEMLETARLMVGWSLARKGDISSDVDVLNRAIGALNRVGAPFQVDAVFLRGLVRLRQSEILFRSALEGAVGAPLDSALATLKEALSDLRWVQQKTNAASVRASTAYWAGEAQILVAKVQALLALGGRGTLPEKQLASLSDSFDQLTRNQRLEISIRRASQIAAVYTQMAGAVTRMLRELNFNTAEKLDLNSLGLAASPSDFCGSLPGEQSNICLSYFAALFGLRPGMQLQSFSGDLAFWEEWANLLNFMVFGNVWRFGSLGMSAPNLASWFTGTDAHVKLRDLFQAPTLPGAQPAVATEYRWARAIVRASLGNPVVTLPESPSQLWPPAIRPTLQNVAPLAEISRNVLNLIAPPATLPKLSAPNAMGESIRMCMTLGGLLGRRWYRYAFYLLQYPEAQKAFGPLQPILGALARYLGADAQTRDAIAGQSHQELWQIYKHSNDQNTKFAALSALAVLHLFQGDLCDTGPGDDVASACRNHAVESPLFAYTGQYFCHISDLSNSLLQVARCQVAHYPELGYQWWNFKVQSGPAAATCESPAQVENEYRADWWIPEFSHLSPSRKLYIALRKRTGLFWLALSPAPGVPTFWRPELLTTLHVPGPTEFRVQAEIPVSLELGLPGLAKHVILMMNGEPVLNQTVTDASLSLKCYSGQQYGILVWADGRWPRYSSIMFSAPGERKKVDLIRAPRAEAQTVKTYETDAETRLPLWWANGTTLWMKEGGYASQLGDRVYAPGGAHSGGAPSLGIAAGGQTYVLDGLANRLIRISDGQVFDLPETLGRVRDLTSDGKRLYVLGDRGKFAMLALPDLASEGTYGVSPLSISICRASGATWIGDMKGPTIWVLSAGGDTSRVRGMPAAVQDGLLSPSRVLFDEQSGYVGVVDPLSRKLFFFLPNGEYVGSVKLPGELDWDWVSWDLTQEGLTVRFGVPGAVEEAIYRPGGTYAFRPAGNYQVPEQAPTIPTGGWIVVRTTW